MGALANIPSGGEANRREIELVSAVLRKDRKATAEFVSQCSDWIYPFLCRRFPRTAMAEDLMQEILISAWQDLEKFRGDAGLRAWVLGIARHKIDDYYRKRLREVPIDESDAETEPAVGLQIQERLTIAAERERVEQTLTQLPEAYGLALIWRYRDGKSLREMAAVTGKTEKAIERLLARARESFKKRWNDDQSRRGTRIQRTALRDTGGE